MNASQLFRVFVWSFVVVVLLGGVIGQPLMAVVTFGLEDNSDGSVKITIDTGGDVVRGVALRVICDNGASLVDYSYTVNPKFNTFIDYHAVHGTGGVIGTPNQEGHPFVGNIGDTDFIISMGVLDETGQQGGYNGSGDLITFNIGFGGVCIGLDTVRGGVVGDVELITNLDGGAQVCLIPQYECLKVSASFYPDWEAWGKPDCWCYQKQCRGDADGLLSGPFRVAIPDLQIFLGAYNQLDAQLALSSSGICADFDHIKNGPFRVGIPDLQIFLEYFNDLDMQVPICDIIDYNFWVDH